MEERSILFSASMVRAILDGRKTQTRRVTKLQHLPNNPPRSFKAYEFERLLPNGSFTTSFGFDGGEEYAQCVCPYGKPGDRLWVRETWAAGVCADGFSPKCLHVPTWKVDNGGLWFKADDHNPTSPISERGRWRQSIHMPRWASRIDLLIKDVRVERLLDIDEKDALAEGCDPVSLPTVDGATFMSYTAGFETLWEKINGIKSWESNPWVWVIEFERVTSIDG